MKKRVLTQTESNAEIDDQLAHCYDILDQIHKTTVPNYKGVAHYANLTGAGGIRYKNALKAVRELRNCIESREYLIHDLSISIKN